MIFDPNCQRNLCSRPSVKRALQLRSAPLDHVLIEMDSEEIQQSVFRWNFLGVKQNAHAEETQVGRVPRIEDGHPLERGRGHFVAIAWTWHLLQHGSMQPYTFSQIDTRATAALTLLKVSYNSSRAGPCVLLCTSARPPAGFIQDTIPMFDRL